MVFPRERLGKTYELNWTICKYAVIPNKVRTASIEDEGNLRFNLNPLPALGRRGLPQSPFARPPDAVQRRCRYASYPVSLPMPPFASHTSLCGSTTQTRTRRCTSPCPRKSTPSATTSCCPRPRPLPPRARLPPSTSCSSPRMPASSTTVWPRTSPKRCSLSCADYAVGVKSKKLTWCVCAGQVRRFLSEGRYLFVHDGAVGSHSAAEEKVRFIVSSATTALLLKYVARSSLSTLLFVASTRRLIAPNLGLL